MGASLAPLSWISSFACALLYEAGLRDAMVLGKCEQSEQGAGRGESTVLCTLSYPEAVSTPCAILSGRSFFRLNYRTSFERAQLIRSRKRHPPF